MTLHNIVIALVNDNGLESMYDAKKKERKKERKKENDLFNERLPSLPSQRLVINKLDHKDFGGKVEENQIEIEFNQ